MAEKQRVSHGLGRRINLGCSQPLSVEGKRVSRRIALKPCRVSRSAPTAQLLVEGDHKSDLWPILLPGVEPDVPQVVDRCFVPSFRLLYFLRRRKPSGRSTRLCCPTRQVHVTTY